MTCKTCNGFGYLLTAPSTCSAGGERRSCPVCAPDAAASEAGEVERLREALTKARDWLDEEPAMGPAETAAYNRLMIQIDAALTSTQGGGGGMSDIAAIAAGLTKAQRATIRALGEFPATLGCSQPCAARLARRNSRRPDLVRIWPPTAQQPFDRFSLTEDGLAVRAHLAQQESTHDQ